MLTPPYPLRLARLALRDPRKLPTMLRLKLGRHGPRDSAEAREAAAGPVAPPLVVALRLGYRCNLRCRMCGQWGEAGLGHQGELPERTLTTDDVKRLIDELAAWRPYLYLTGGEPLLEPDLGEVIRHASSRHLPVSLSTNGTLLARRARELIDAGLDYLYLSLDAPAPGEAAIRREPEGADSQARAAAGARELLRARDAHGVGLPLVQVQTIVVEENHRSLQAMARYLADELRPDVWGLQLCVHTSAELAATHDAELRRRFGTPGRAWSGFARSFPGLDPAALEAELRALQARRWPFRLRLYRPLGLPGLELGRYFDEPARPSFDPGSAELVCLNPYLFAQVEPDGSVACCGSQPDHKLGDVRERGLLALWNGERARAWRRGLAEGLLPACPRCFSLHEYLRFRRRR